MVNLPRKAHVPTFQAPFLRSRLPWDRSLRLLKTSLAWLAKWHASSPGRAAVGQYECTNSDKVIGMFGYYICTILRIRGNNMYIYIHIHTYSCYIAKNEDKRFERWKPWAIWNIINMLFMVFLSSGASLARPFPTTVQADSFSRLTRDAGMVAPAILAKYPKKELQRGVLMDAQHVLQQQHQQQQQQQQQQNWTVDLHGIFWICVFGSRKRCEPSPSLWKGQ